jgi:outer membrane protein assembly factor BamB
METVLWARSLATGRVLWSRTLAGQGGIAIEGGRLYAGLGDYQEGRILALDPREGEVLWSTTAREDLAMPFTPVPTRESVFAMSARLVAVAAVDGSPRWAAPPDVGVLFGSGTPAIEGDAIVVAGGGWVAAFDASSGEPRWNTEGLDTIGEPVSVKDGIVYAAFYGGGLGGHLMALDLDDGTVLWERKEIDAWYTSVAVAPTAVLLPMERWRQLPAQNAAVVVGWELRALDPTTGRLLWSVGEETREHVTIAPPVVVGDELIFDLGSSLRILSLADGSTLGEIRGAFGSTIVAGGLVLAEADDGKITAVAAAPSASPDATALVPDPALQPPVPTVAPVPTGTPAPVLPRGGSPSSSPAPELWLFLGLAAVVLAAATVMLGRRRPHSP